MTNKYEWCKSLALCLLHTALRLLDDWFLNVIENFINFVWTYFVIHTYFRISIMNSYACIHYQCLIFANMRNGFSVSIQCRLTKLTQSLIGNSLIKGFSNGNDFLSLLSWAWHPFTEKAFPKDDFSLTHWEGSFPLGLSGLRAISLRGFHLRGGSPGA